MARPRTITDAGLLDAAREVFIRKGVGASTREIARRAGVSEGVLYQRYATKQDLFFASMVLPAADLTTLVQARRTDGRTHLEDVALVMTDYFRSTMPVLQQVMAHPGFEFENFARRYPDSPMDGLRRGLITFFVEQRKAGRIGPVDPGAAALVVLAVAECVAFLERMGAHGGRFPPELLTRAVACLWEGLKPAPPAPDRPKPARGLRGRYVRKRPDARARR